MDEAQPIIRDGEADDEGDQLLTACVMVVDAFVLDDHLYGPLLLDRHIRDVPLILTDGACLFSPRLLPAFDLQHGEGLVHPGGAIDDEVGEQERAAGGNGEAEAGGGESRPPRFMTAISADGNRCPHSGHRLTHQ